MAEFDESIISDKDRGYFAAKPAKECVSALIEKSDQYYQTLESMGWWEKLRNMYAATYGAYNTSVGNAHQLTFSGDDGEYTDLVANHFRNIGRNMHTMITSIRPAMETRAVNRDQKSQVQTKLGNGLLDYYMRGSGKNVEERLKLACEMGIFLGMGGIKMSWNPNAGEMTNGEEIVKMTRLKQFGQQVKIPKPEYQGDIEFSMVSPFDLVEDITKEDIKHDWKIVRSFKNKFDLIKVHPELTDQLMRVKTKSELPNLNLVTLAQFDKVSDDVPIYEFYHDRTECVPEGRYILYCNDETILYDGPLPYRRIPIYTLKPSVVMGTPLGHSDMFDLLPLQDAVNMLYSTITTNQAAFGVQTILNPVGNNIDVAQINNGLSVLTYNPNVNGGGKPEALQLTKTPPEIFQFVQFLIQTMETISGINSVVRGNPEANLRSGSAIAMIQSNAIQYMSNAQAQYVRLIEDVGLGILQMLIDFADSPRIADIVGISGKSYVKTFKGEDLRSINRVIVDSANPMSKTNSGRINMADNLLQYGTITPQQYMNVMNTGNLEVATDSTVNVQMSIQKENEAMLEGRQVLVYALEKHSVHILGHQELIADPDMKEDPELLKIVGDHINEHLRMLRETDPDILMSIGEQPLRPMPPEGGAPPPPAGPVPPAPQGQPPVAPQNEAVMPPQEQALAQQGAQPNAVRLPPGMENVPLTPQENLQRMQGA